LSGAKVIPIPTLTPLRNSGEYETRTRPRRAPVRPIRRNTESQQRLDFHEVREAFTAGDESIVCDAPVAPPAHRLIAAAFDAAMVLLGVGLFLGIFYLSGGALVFTRQTIPLLGSVVAVLSLFYRFMWCIAGGDTPGMRFAGLRLVDFDGRLPDREQRSVRQVASLLSLVSAGLGLVWALVDEEKLTWHDHISKTFPTSS